MNLPQARIKDIVVQNLGNEMLVYDLKTNKLYNLNETSAKVFNACNGETSFAELKTKYKFTDNLIYLALDELKANELLEDYKSNHFAGLSRREVIKKVGLASMIALPLISVMVAPTAAHAQSTSVCVTNSCADGGPTCNQGNGGCTTLGLVCCFVLNSCNCTTAASCSGSGGQICP